MDVKTGTIYELNFKGLIAGSDPTQTNLLLEVVDAHHACLVGRDGDDIETGHLSTGSICPVG